MSSDRGFVMPTAGEQPRERPETMADYGTETGYPATVSTDDNGTVTSITFKCLAHGIDPARCESCAEAERSSFAHANRYAAYVDSTFEHVITFGGFWLAQIKNHRISKRHRTPTGGTYRMAYVTAIAPDGSLWNGAYNYEGGELVTLRRSGETAG